MEIQLSNSYPFNLGFTLDCGQAFRWNKRGEWWYGVVREKGFKIRQVSNKLEFENVDADFVKDYFGLRDDLPKIFSQITIDKHIKAADKKFNGLRILRQDPWGVGYRAKYISETAKTIYGNDFKLEGLKKIGYEKARRELLTFPGVGLKVADCVLLFSLEKLEAFPVDTWLRRIIIKYYASHFPREFIGYAQEYLYHFERTQC